MTETFAADWLDLREGADHAARPRALLTPLIDWCRGRVPLEIVDLGAGAGSNLRYLAALLPRPQRWLLLDHDPALLRLTTAPGGDVTVERACRDLAAATTVGALTGHLVTASALLDLVSEAWIERLAARCEAIGAAALLALSYDGAIRWSPVLPEDELARQAVNAHQQRDKGLGAALGPDAATTAAAAFRQRGYRVELAPSPWQLGAADTALQEALLAGWVGAAAEQRPDAGGTLRAWARARRELIASGQSRLQVGHLDLLALPREAS